MHRPLELSLLQTAVVQPEPVEAPVQYLELVAIVVAKDKQAFRKGIELKAFCDQYRQSVDGLPQIRDTCGQIDPAVDSLV